MSAFGPKRTWTNHVIHNRWPTLADITIPPRYRGAEELHFLKNVDLQRAGEHHPPGLQKSLHPNVAGDALPVELPVFVGLVFDLLDELGRVVDVLQQAHLGIAEHLVERR